MPLAPPGFAQHAHRGGRIVAALGDIKIAHSVFALPFAVLGAVLASPASRAEAARSEWRRLAAQLALIVACMFFARTWAMLVNRLADKDFDAANPRTIRRAIASGRLAARDGLVVALAAATAFLACCGLFWLLFSNPWPLIFAAPTLAWIAFYSFTKRFTALSHVFLGGALAASPIAAAVAVHPPALAETPALWLIAGMVVFWVAGFDVAYALQDIEFDRSAGLRSIPARLGARGALWVSRGMHATAFALLFAAWRVEARFAALFLSAVIAVGALLVFEHVVLTRRGVAGLPLAFFTVNGVVSCILGAAGCVDALI